MFSDAVLIAALNVLGLVAIAYFQNKKIQETRTEIAAKVDAVATTVADVKAQTDGLTSALVAKTEEKMVMAVDAATLAGGEAERLRGAEKAATLEEGRRKGMEAAVAQAVGPVPVAAPLSVAPGESPVPVADKKVGDAVEKMAEATGKVAEATDKLTEAKK